MSADLSRLVAALSNRYHVDRELGQGGMATVYLAEDLKHKRKVALKVLKPELAAVLGADRFVQEITTTAALQHPHILPLFDSGEADGFLYYVMPFIDGETLRAKLDRERQLGIDEAVRIASDVLDALHYAHEHGVVHRDIKPENILLHGGRPMVADFGIALALSAAAGGRMTETGLSLGTPHYMSPEQATAEKDISARSDVYSLGSVLYEMLTGSPPHVGATAQQIIMKIVTEEAAPVTKLRKAVPPNVAAAVATSLEKMPADRFASARAFADALANPSYASIAMQRAGDSRVSARDWRTRAAIPALVVASLLGLTAAWSALRRTEVPVVARYQVELPDGRHVSNTQWSPLAVSPDGSTLVYQGESGRLVVRSRDRLELMELAGTEGAYNPFFSRDGKKVGYMTGPAGTAELRAVPVIGGPPTVVTGAGVGGPGAAWGYDGYIYFDASGVGPLMRVRETGGPNEAVSVLDSASGERQHNWPDPLPGGRGVLVVIDHGGPGVNMSAQNDIGVVDLGTRKIRVLVRGVFARYAASGHILYVTSSGVMMAVPFDLKTLQLAGNPVALWEGTSVRRGGGGVDLAISQTGTLWYGLRKSAGQREVAWATTGGRFAPVDSGWFGDFGSLALSHDGRRVAVSMVDSDGEQIWVKQLDRAHGPQSKLTFEKGVHTLPRWHPDDSRILFTTNFLTAGTGLQSVRADGSAQPVPLLKDVVASAGQWTPDGTEIVYEKRRTRMRAVRDIFAARPGTDTTGRPLVVTEFTAVNPSVSPDGHWLLYEGNSTGHSEVYARPYPNTAESLVQISNGGGARPKWSRDGREIIYENNNSLVRVTVTAGKSLIASDQRVVMPLAGIWGWDVTKDKDRFIVVHDRDGAQWAKLVVVENMFEELRTRVPR